MVAAEEKWTGERGKEEDRSMPFESGSRKQEGSAVVVSNQLDGSSRAGVIGDGENVQSKKISTLRTLASIQREGDKKSYAF